MDQISMFDIMYPTFKVDKPVRLIELFAGVGSQAMALRNLGVPFEHYLMSEWEMNAVASYKAIHMGNDNTDYSADMTSEEVTQALIDYGISADGKKPLTEEQIRKHQNGERWRRECYNNIRATHNLVNICAMHGKDLQIVEPEKYTYLLTYLLIPVSRFKSGREDERNEKGIWNTIRSFVGSRKVTQ